MTDAVDVHQHLWPRELVDRLRARSQAPCLRGWTLYTEGEAPFVIDRADHDPSARVAADLADGIGTACVSLSAPLGIESLPRAEAGTLVEAWHRGVRDLPEHFRAWASVPDVDPDLTALAAVLHSERFVGLQLPATRLLTPAGWERASAVLRLSELAGKPVLVHPGPVAAPRDTGDGGLPGWWAPVVDYVAQLQAAWWAWHALDGRASFPGLRVVFAAAAGLAPVHHERHAARGGTTGPLDPDVFVDTSGYGPRALDAVVRTLGIDALVLGSDRPYAEPLTDLLGEAASHAVRVTNPRRLLGTGLPLHEKGAPTWAFAS